jgi:hypothetical protein
MALLLLWEREIHLKTSNWTPAFAGVTYIRKAWFFVVIPAEAGIQDD